MAFKHRGVIVYECRGYSASIQVQIVIILIPYIARQASHVLQNSVDVRYLRTKIFRRVYSV